MFFKTLTCFVFMLAGVVSSAQQNLMAGAKAAYNERDFEGYYHQMKTILEQRPWSARAMYGCGVGAALTRRNNEAIKYLNLALYSDASLDLMSPDFDSLRSLQSFKDLINLQHMLREVVMHSDTALLLRDRQLHIEEVIAFRRRFFFGSIYKRKIVSMDDRGREGDFVATAQDGLGSVMALCADKLGKLLWATSAKLDITPQDKTKVIVGLFAFDLHTGKTKRVCALPDTLTAAVLGDLVADAAGQLYTSDSRYNVVYKYDAGTNALLPWLKSPRFRNIQGIAFSDDQRYLFVADYLQGIFRYDMATQQLILLKNNFDLSLTGCDGLLFYQNGLIAIQNGVTPLRCLYLHLDDDQETLIACSVIDNDHPAFGEPTNGCLDGDDLYYIANSSWNGYQEDNSIKSEAELHDIVLLKTRLSVLK